MTTYIVLNLLTNTYELTESETAETLAATLGGEIDHLIDRSPAYQIIELNANVLSELSVAPGDNIKIPASVLKRTR